MVSQRQRERVCHKMLRSGHCHGFTKTERESVLQNAEVWTLSWFHKDRERECHKMLRSGHCHGFTKTERESVTKY